MKPITDDVIHSLIRGVERREKTALKRMAARVQATRGAASNALTARILPFTAAEAEDNRKREGAGEVVALDKTRAERRVRRTVAGIFSYAR